MEEKRQVVLQKYVENFLKDEIDISTLSIDSYNFTEQIKLYDYQERALSNILLLLMKYFSDFKDKELNKGHINQILHYYETEITEDIKEHISYKNKDKHFNLIKDYFPIEDRKISYSNFINRASFWMATGSGKSLIIIKLIELLYKLMIQEIIPTKKVMLLIPSDEIYNQIKKHIDIFNKATIRSSRIELKDIKEYEKSEFAGINPLQPNSLTVYYGRTIHISDIDKDKLIDFRTIIEEDGWYLIIDEAHKGDSDFSIRKQYFNILSKNGFMFNFSATFTDDIDIVTTILDFNLAEFIKSGYGKNIKILDDEYRNFKPSNTDKGDLQSDEKQEIILKSLIIFAAIKKQYNYLQEINKTIYHNPLMLTVSNEINTKNADMKLYFKYLAHIASKEIDSAEINYAKNELVEKLESSLNYLIGIETLNEQFIDTIKGIDYNDILNYVFNSESRGEIEVYQLGSNNDELSFKLKTSSAQPFTLIKASNIKSWRKNILQDYLFIDDVVSGDSRFKTIHLRDNRINILMGSRQFIEGWDSNRPNVINFINMGVDDDNTKMILQAIGRGVRIEPFDNERKRFKYIKDQKKYYDLLTKEERQDISMYGEILESLFVFATNKEVISNIIKGIETEKDNWNKIKGIKRQNFSRSVDLLVPKYEEVQGNNKTFIVSKQDFNDVERYIDSTSEKLLLIRDDLQLNTIKAVKEKNKIYFDDIESVNKNPIELLRKLQNHINMKSKKLTRFEKETKYVDICHYQEIQTTYDEENLIELEKFIKNSLQSKDKKNIYDQNTDYNYMQKLVIKEIRGLYAKGQKIDDETRKAALDLNIHVDDIVNDISISNLENKFRISPRSLSNHYYNPILISKDNSKEYKHIVKEESEIDFLDELEKFLESEEYKKIGYDWWYFSKLVENVDSIYIPYYDKEKQKNRKFYPDFIFWMKKGDIKYIKFVDPKGLKHEANVVDKIEGFEEIFIGNNVLDVDNINVELLLYNKEHQNNELIKEYKFYDIKKIFED